MGADVKIIEKRNRDKNSHFGSGHFQLEITCDLFTVGEVGLCVFFRDPGDCLSLVPVWFCHTRFSG